MRGWAADNDAMRTLPDAAPPAHVRTHLCQGLGGGCDSDSADGWQLLPPRACLRHYTSVGLPSRVALHHVLMRT
jgi:hypothetical protein